MIPSAIQDTLLYTSMSVNSMTKKKTLRQGSSEYYYSIVISDYYGHKNRVTLLSAENIRR